MKSRELGPEEIVAEFQRRRRLTRLISNGTTWLGLGGAAGIVAYAMSLHDLEDPPYGLFAAFGAAVAIFVIGAIVHPHLYRCPSCRQRVQVPDPTESGNILLKDPAICPNCGARLK